MVELASDEVEIALVALRHTKWKGEQQIKAGDHEHASSAAWYCTRYCVGRFEALIDKLEKADG